MDGGVWPAGVADGNVFGACNKLVMIRLCSGTSARPRRLAMDRGHGAATTACIDALPSDASGAAAPLDAITAPPRHTSPS